MTSALEIRRLTAGYQGGTVLDDLSLTLEPGKILGVLGRNGVGKSTLTSAIMGLVDSRSGSISFRGETISGWPSHRIAKFGVALVPQGRRIFAGLSVDDHLRMAERFGRPGAWDVERVYGTFPRLRERIRNGAQTLSGGEQQMLAIGRALVQNPQLLLLDEPSDGLAPAITSQIVRTLADSCKETGVTVFMVEQAVPVAVAVADDLAVMGKGRILEHWSSSRSTADLERASALLALGAAEIDA
jgi:branched-chain amino acid transport system ATP-binding protein